MMFEKNFDIEVIGSRTESIHILTVQVSREHPNGSGDIIIGLKGPLVERLNIEPSTWAAMNDFVRESVEKMKQ